MLAALGLLQDRVPAGLDDRAEGDHVDLLLDVGPDRLDLVLLLLLGVGELQVDALGLSAASWMDLVFAVRQPLSAPTWAKPIVMESSPLSPPPPESEPAARGERERAQGDRASGDQALLQHCVSSRFVGLLARCDRCHFGLSVSVNILGSQGPARRCFSTATRQGERKCERSLSGRAKATTPGDRPDRPSVVRRRSSAGPRAPARPARPRLPARRRGHAG